MRRGSMFGERLGRLRHICAVAVGVTAVAATALLSASPAAAAPSAESYLNNQLRNSNYLMPSDWDAQSALDLQSNLADVYKWLVHAKGTYDGKKVVQLQ